jgi:cytochrome c553
MLKFVQGFLDRTISFKVILVIMAVFGAVAATFVLAGGVDIAADKPDGWLAEHALHFVFNRTEASRSHGVASPDDLTSPARVQLAAQQFDMECANCHGRPGFGQSVIALSMSPRPQYLPKVLGQFTDAELYMIVKHGVKYSAMPAWPATSRVDEIWSMVAFLKQLPKLDADSYRKLTALPANANAGLGAMGDDTSLRPANAQRDAPPANEFLYAAPSAGFADQTIHDAPLPTCARCHGADGSGNVTGGEAPNLTIQSAAYLKGALQAYTSGARKSGFMQNMAAQLSSQQIDALSNYYAGLPVQTSAAAPGDPMLIKRGQEIAAQGVPGQAIPACSNCHESAGAEVIGAPHIAGQSATFIRRQLEIMSRAGRGSTVRWNPMFTIAHALSDHDVAALAAYYSSLKATKGFGANPAPPAPAPAIQSAANLSGAKATFATVCMKCHVNGGRGDLGGDYPNLTLQTSPYVAQSLYAFHIHNRDSGKMQEVTNALTLDQMGSLAAYISGLPPQPTLAKFDAAAASRGAAIATNGIPARGIPACLSCHGQQSVAALPLIPRLQGQNPTYLVNRLRTFSRPNARSGDGLNPMPQIAAKLTEKESADLAAYFAAAPPLAKSASR